MSTLSWARPRKRPYFWMVALVAAAACGTAQAERDGWRAAAVCGAGPGGDRPAGMDADADAVPDSEDWCPKSAPGARVGSNGCAAHEIAVNCPTAPAAPRARVVPIVAAGDDADHDGVSDDDDKCPGTPRGADVDRKGCVVIEKVVLKGVNFATGSAKLKPGASETLRTVASAMKAAPDLEVEIQGHTDSVGDEGKNQKLSERRAEAVKVFLVGEGIDDDRLSVKGYGETQPVDRNDTAEGRANNRRVSFKVTDD